MYINKIKGNNTIDLFDELKTINEEHELKKKLEKDIDLTYMDEFDENIKRKSLHHFQQIQYYMRIKNNENLKTYLQKFKLIKQNLTTNFDEKLEHDADGQYEYVERGQLENSKDRINFLSGLKIKYDKLYDPVKNYMQKFDMESKLVEEKKNKERDKNLQILKNNQIMHKLHQYYSNVRRKKHRSQYFWEQNETEKNKLDRLKSIKDYSTPKIIEDVLDVLKSGVYKLPEYERALIFKFFITINIGNKIDLLDNDGDILLHINFRDNMVVLNSNIDNNWGIEERISSKIGGYVEVKILAKDNYFKILVDNKILGFFESRKDNSKIEYIDIDENMNTFIFKTM